MRQWTQIASALPTNKFTFYHTYIILPSWRLDCRQLDHTMRESIRIRAFRHIEDEQGPEVIAAALGFHQSCVSDWIARYREGGIEVLSAKPMPRAKICGKAQANFSGFVRLV